MQQRKLIVTKVENGYIIAENDRKGEHVHVALDDKSMCKYITDYMNEPEEEK